MRFLERVKATLLNQIDERIGQIEDRINELSQEYSSKFENVESQRKELEDVLQGKTEIQKKKIEDRELNDIVTVYNFMTYYKRIKYIVEELKKMPRIENEYEYPDTYTAEMIDEENLRRKNILLDELKKLNEKLKNIDEITIDEDSQEDDKPISTQKSKERGFFSRLFGKGKIEDTSYSYRENNDSKKNIFTLYKRTISEFKKYYNDFLTQTDGQIVDQNAGRRNTNNIRKLTLMQKDGVELYESEIQLLEFLKPWELWPEILRYYSNMEKLRIIIQNFEARIDYYEQLYKEDPGYFDIHRLQGAMEEHKIILEDLKEKKKDANCINVELSKSRDIAKGIKDQITTQTIKKKKLLEERKKVEKAKSLSELGYKDKKDASDKLSIDAKDYIIIPIPSTVSDINELFNYSQQLKIQIDGKTFYSSYANEVAFGNINHLKNTESTIGAILVPINELDKSNIDCARGDRIGLKKSIFSISGIKVFLKQGTYLKYKGTISNAITYINNDLEQQIKDFLGEDYLADDEKPDEYQVLKKIPNVSHKESQLKREAVRRCLFENLNRDVTHKDRILLNGKQYFLNTEDEKEMWTKPKEEEINFDLLIDIICKIEDYLKDKKSNSAYVDLIYSNLLKEYLRVIKKAKADYIEEEGTVIVYDDKKISIKPPLPAKNEDIAKRYTRPNEDVAYKLMKLANLINNFAHITKDEAIQFLLFEKKLDLIERVIDLSKDNPEIHIKKQFDEYKKAMTVIMEIPGYNMIALHTINTSRQLMNKINRLEEKDNNVVRTSAILYPGVNRELLTLLKKMDFEKRRKFLLEIDPNTFYKLIMRMGYHDVKLTSDEEKEKFISTFISNEKLDKLLGECSEIERE